jgi:hypothetical protein
VKIPFAPLDVVTFTIPSRILNDLFIVRPATTGDEAHMFRAIQVNVAYPFSLFGIVVVFAAIGNYLLCCQPVERVSPGLLTWWTVLCAVSICNIWMWFLSSKALAERRDSLDPATYRYQRWQLYLSAAYVFGCAFRALLPRADVQRFGLFDTWVSCVLVGRTVATIAELGFAVQWALFLDRLSKQADSRAAAAIARWLVPLIVLAEVCSWYGVLTTSYLGNTIEESLWAVSGFLLVLGFFLVRARTAPATRPLLDVATSLGVVYVAYMCLVDVPMYASRWLQDQANGREYLSLSHGIWDAGSRWIVTHAWDQWHPEIPWMSLYFSVGVWCSLALIHLPRGHTTVRRDAWEDPAC